MCQRRNLISCVTEKFPGFYTCELKCPREGQRAARKDRQHGRRQERVWSNEGSAVAPHPTDPFTGLDKVPESNTQTGWNWEGFITVKFSRSCMVSPEGVAHMLFQESSHQVP